MKGRRWGEYLRVAVLALGGAASLWWATEVENGGFAMFHDELWNVPGTVALVRGQSWNPAYEVKIFGLRFPLVSGPYQGAFKTYLLAPVVGLCGTSPQVLRGLNAVLGWLYLAALFKAFSKLAPPRVAALVFLLPLADPNFLWFVPLDYGPFLLCLIFVALGLGALVRAVTNRSQRFLPLVALAAGLVLGDKLTSLPAALSLLILGGIVAWQRRKDLQTSVRTGLLALVLFMLPLLPFAAYFFVNGFAEFEANTHFVVPHWLKALTLKPEGASRTQPPFSLSARLFSFVAGLKDIGSAHFIPYALSGERVTVSPPWAFAIFLALGLMAFPMSWVLSRKRGESSTCPLLAGSWLIVCAIFVAIPGLDRPWHFLQLQPFLVAAVFAGVWALNRTLTKAGWARFVKLFLALVLALAGYRQAIRGWELGMWLRKQQGVNLTSPALYHVAQTLSREKPKRVICVNYGGCNPLYVLWGAATSRWWT